MRTPLSKSGWVDPVTVEILTRWRELTPEQKKEFLAKAKALVGSEEKESA